MSAPEEIRRNAPGDGMVPSDQLIAFYYWALEELVRRA